MPRSPRLWFFAFASVGLVALGAHALAWWGGRANAWGAARELLWELRRSEALGVREDKSRRYNEGKKAITAEVVAGRLSLAEAAERFGQLADLFEGDPALLGAYRAPDGERELARNVITWAVAAPPDNSSRRAAVLAHLLAEYRERFGADDSPELAAVSAGLAPRTHAAARRRARPHRLHPSRSGRPAGHAGAGTARLAWQRARTCSPRLSAALPFTPAEGRQISGPRR
jgi:hypothetical protein